MRVNVAARVPVIGWQRMRTLAVLAAVIAIAAGSGEAAAQPEAGETEPGAAAFGPLIAIERIDVVGNSSTAEHIIRRALPIRAGDRLRAGDSRLSSARYKVLALGYFRDVQLTMAKGSRRGQVVLTVAVVERGTVILERMYFGISQVTPWWAGLDVSERNFFGTGLGVGGAFVFAGEGDAAGADPQRAFQLRVSEPSIAGMPLGLHAVGQYVDASEPYRVRGEADDGDADNFAAFGYRRIGGRVGASWDVTPLSTVSVGARLELVDTDLPAMPQRTLPDGRIVPIDLHLLPGDSRVATASVGFDRDTRADPVLPFSGDRWQLFAELGAGVFGSDYDYATLLAKYQRWWSVSSVEHVISLHLTGGVVVGDAPRFDRLHVGDLNRMVSPRALGLVVSATPSHDILGTATEDATYGKVGGVAEVQYSYRLFRSDRHIYGGDLFVGVGLWALGQGDDFDPRDETLYRSLPVDLLLDAGLRLDTEIGIFELTIANALGRVPL